MDRRYAAAGTVHTLEMATDASTLTHRTVAVGISLYHSRFVAAGGRLLLTVWTPVSATPTRDGNTERMHRLKTPHPAGGPTVHQRARTLIAGMTDGGSSRFSAEKRSRVDTVLCDGVGLVE